MDTHFWVKHKNKCWIQQQVEVYQAVQFGRPTARQTLPITIAKNKLCNPNQQLGLLDSQMTRLSNSLG